MAVLDQTPRSKKRQRDPLESLPRDCPKDPPSTKRRKSAPEATTSRWHRPPGYWNRLSKVHLSKAALREFDSRTLKAGLSILTLDSSITPSSGPRTQSVEEFSRHGGPDLSHIRGFANLTDQGDAMSQSGSGSKPTRKTKSSYDPNFEQNLIDSGIYPDGYEPDAMSTPLEPNNFEDLRSALRAPRASLSPSRFTNTDFLEFKRMAKRVRDEATARAEVISIIAGDSGKQNHRASDRLFNHLTPFSDNLPQAKPDLYDGAFPQKIDRRVRSDLGNHIVPCNKTSLPAAPNFFLEGKSNEGRADVALRQACHDGAIGARAMHSLQNYKSATPNYDGNAYSHSATYHQGNAVLQLYAHHLTAPKAPGERPECRMTRLSGYLMTNDREQFVAGASAFRNLRDLAKAKRDVFIDHANEVAGGRPADTLPTTLTDSRTSLSMVQEDESDNSADELALEQTTPKRKRCATAER